MPHGAVTGLSGFAVSGAGDFNGDGLDDVVIGAPESLVGEVVHVGSSYLAGEDHRIHFGVGSAVAIPEVTIEWLDGSIVTLRNLAADRSYRAAP